MLGTSGFYWTFVCSQKLSPIRLFTRFSEDVFCYYKDIDHKWYSFAELKQTIVLYRPCLRKEARKFLLYDFTNFDVVCSRCSGMVRERKLLTVEEKTNKQTNKQTNKKTNKTSKQIKKQTKTRKTVSQSFLFLSRGHIA